MKLTKENIKNTAWDLSKQTEEERALWQEEMFKLGVEWNYSRKTTVDNVDSMYFFINGGLGLTYDSGTTFTPWERKLRKFEDVFETKVPTKSEYVLLTHPNQLWDFIEVLFLKLEEDLYIGTSSYSFNQVIDHFNKENLYYKKEIPLTESEIKVASAVQDIHNAQFDIDEDTVKDLCEMLMERGHFGE